MKINVKAFVKDFGDGVPDVDLQLKFGLSGEQVGQLVAALKRRGDITPEHAEHRRACLGAAEVANPDAAPVQDPPVVKVDLDTGLVLHCPSCGAAVKRDAERCDYCHSHLDFSLTGKTTHCPHCYERIPAESRFCFRCARPVTTTDQPGEVHADRLCPRCAVPMATRTVGDFPLIACEKCGGLFVTHETFEMMQDSSQRVIETGALSKPAHLELEKKVTYVRCPVCHTMMNRKNFAQISGVIVDVCGHHGTWFDPGELEKLMDFIARGGLLKARAKEEERLKELETLERLRREEHVARGESPLLLMPEYPLEGKSPDLIDILSKAFTLFKE